MLTNRSVSRAMRGAEGSSAHGRQRRLGRRRLLLEQLEPRTLLDAALGSTLAGSPVHPEQVQVTEYNVLTGEQCVLDLAETQQAVAALEQLDAQATAEGFDGLQGLLAKLGSPPKSGSASGASDQSEPLYVFGSDGRTRVKTTTNFPWSAVGQIATGYSDGSWGWSSGAMISPYHMLTAAHCVRKSSDAGGTFASSMHIAFGQNGTQWGGTSYDTALQSTGRFFGEANAVYFRSYAWSNTNFDYDIALVTLDRRIGDYTGWFGYGWNDNNAAFQNVKMNSAGYPADRNGTSFSTHYLYQAYDAITTVNTNQLRSTRLDMNPGNSGGPLWKYFTSNKQRIIYGVASHMMASNDTPVYNAWTRVTSDKFNYFQTSISEDNSYRAPTDRPDLVDWDSWFNSDAAYFSESTAWGGRSWSVTSYPRNNGTATAGSFRVSYYASANTTISTYDYFLGSTTVSSLSPFRWTTATWSGSFPASVPTGSYYVGWIIDSDSGVSEFNESNNTGLVDRKMLTVTDPVYVSVNSPSVTEGDKGTKSAAFMVTLSRACSVAVTVQYATADGSALRGLDYKGVSGKVTFSRGQTQKTIKVPVIGNRTAEPTEYFYVNLTNPKNGCFGVNQTWGTIYDNDTAVSLASISVENTSAGDSVVAQWTDDAAEAGSALLSLLPKKKAVGPIQQAADAALVMFQADV